METSEANEYIWIPVGTSGKPKPRDRKSIRSRCMHGKNLRIGVRVEQGIIRSQSARHVSEFQPRGQRGLALFAEETLKEEARLPLLSPCPSDLSLIAGEVDEYSRMLLFNFLTKAEESMYPIAGCIAIEPNMRSWMPWLMQDSAYVYPILFSISIVDCIFARTPLGKRSQYYFDKTLKYIIERLSGSVLHDSVTMLVMSLVVLYSGIGDFTAAGFHMRGLGQMVRLRGGLESFKKSPRCYIKFARIDLAYALHSGEKPVFLPDEAPGPPNLEGLGPWQGVRTHSSFSLPITTIGPNGMELITTLKDLQQLCHIFNAGVTNHRYPSPTEIQNRICSIQYRLLRLQGNLESILTECLRLAMLAFLATTFQVPGTEVNYPFLERSFRDCCRGIEASTPHLQDLMLWFLMIGALSVFRVTEPWLCKRWDAEVPSQMTWEDARERLRNIMWIDAIHDQPGYHVFKTLNHEEVAGADRDKSIVKLWSSSWGGCFYELS
ncbi:hypothetical protein F5884DRAFT_859702 [Xylogone sp. PMI_703]|nr:hypothetical protein F5884DRAFT_859702 [Xylogone sp. PMI_703]